VSHRITREPIRGEVDGLRGDGRGLTRQHAIRLLPSAYLVRVLYERPEGQPNIYAVFGCVTCGDLLEWEPERRLWVCPECGHEIGPDEADLLVKGSKAALKQLEKDVRKRKGGRRWAWLPWSRRR
jgi:DNA-directed RNA polymerase subunit RPC12/RpoP